MTRRTHRPDELETELRSLRPRRPSAAMQARIARELSLPRMLRRAVRHLSWAIPPAAAAMIVLGIWLWPPPGAPRKSSLSPFSQMSEMGREAMDAGAKLSSHFAAAETDVLGLTLDTAHAVESGIGEAEGLIRMTLKDIYKQLGEKDRALLPSGRHRRERRGRGGGRGRREGG